ncbi:MAG: thioredoxin-dependent thiol peroxidase [Actinobacteria bacterium]|nr:MAG: thioredoxin-dependent thiol peroxidase [Actinomycetota bacterium]
MISEGQPAPDVELESDTGDRVKLADFRGKTVVLYFYPKDDTPGCTTEACEFRDTYDRFREQGVEVIGVSPDPVQSHQKFKSKHELPFLLLADPEHKLAEAYGVWGEKKYMGRTYMGINRSTFVIDPEGKVAKAMVGIKPAGHAAQILDQLA